MAKDFKRFPPKSETRSEPLPVAPAPDELLTMFAPDPRQTSVTFNGNTYLVKDGRVSVTREISEVLRKVGYTVRPRA